MAHGRCGPHDDLSLAALLRSPIFALTDEELFTLAHDRGTVSLDAALRRKAGGDLMLSGVVLNALAGALYIGAQFGPGPRDGLMTGLVRRTGLSVRLVRTSLELTVLATGFLLGGSIGVGTVVYALSIGPLVHVLLPIFTVRLKRA